MPPGITIYDQVANHVKKTAIFFLLKQDHDSGSNKTTGGDQYAFERDAKPILFCKPKIKQGGNNIQ